MLKDVEIRKFKSGDLQEVAKLYISIFSQPPWNESWTGQKAEARVEEIMKTPNSLGLICFNKEEAVGFALGHCREFSTGRGFNLQEFGIKPKYQGQQLGTKLMDELVEKLENEGVKGIYLLTARGTKAEKFYLKNNFIQNKERIFMMREFKKE